MKDADSWIHGATAEINHAILETAQARQNNLTKPPGSLGNLEAIATMLAAQQGRPDPQVDQIHISVFAGDHGVAAEGISAFPQAVTGEMVRNYANGGAAINVLAKELNALLEVINLGTVNDPGPLPGVLHIPLGPGTANSARGPAMQWQQLNDAIAAGYGAAQRASQENADLFIAGEMGIGNTTSAAALACVLLQAAPEELAGPGTGLDQAGVLHKVQVITDILELHKLKSHEPLEALRCLGGFEIAAMTGTYLASAQQAMPVLIDGFISSVAALTATRINEHCRQWFLFAHGSAEPGHNKVLQAMDAKPLLNLEMRLGEASGAAVAVPLIRLACSLHNNMATFAEAEVSGINQA